jgi:hypothetical protein
MGEHKLLLYVWLASVRGVRSLHLRYCLIAVCADTAHEDGIVINVIIIASSSDIDARCIMELTFAWPGRVRTKATAFIVLCFVAQRRHTTPHGRREATQREFNSHTP